MFFLDDDTETIENNILNDETEEAAEEVPEDETEEPATEIDSVSDDSLESVLLEESGESEDSTEADSFDYETIISQQNEIISLLSVSGDEIYDSNYDTSLSFDVVGCFLLASCFGCFLCSALFRKW